MLTRTEHLPRLQRRPHYSKHKRIKDYRSEIREDCKCRCVYCDIHDQEAGGEKSMTIDHFRPKHHYPDSKLDPENFVWACGPCNQNKGDDWPAYSLPDCATVCGEFGYLDPFKVDRKDYFDVTSDGKFKALKPPAEYMINTLELNRPLLRKIRRRRDVVYESLLALREYFSAEIQLYDETIARENISDRDKMDWFLDRERLKEFLEIIIALDEVLS